MHSNFGNKSIHGKLISKKNCQEFNRSEETKVKFYEKANEEKIPKCGKLKTASEGSKQGIIFFS